MKKRLLSLALALLMVFSLLPVTAFAARPDYCWGGDLINLIKTASLKAESGDVLTVGSQWHPSVEDDSLIAHHLSAGRLNIAITYDNHETYPRNNGIVVIDSRNIGHGGIASEYMTKAEFHISDDGTLTKLVIYEKNYDDPYALNDNKSYTFASHWHKFDTAWSTDVNAHWHRCTAANCPLTGNGRNSYGTHSDVNTKDGLCDTCGYHMHDHSLSYTAAENVLTATCSASNCYIVNSSVSLTLTASDVIADGQPHGASFGSGEADTWSAVRIGAGSDTLTLPTIIYQKYAADWTTTIGGASETAPTAAGYYKATITAGEGEKAATAENAFTIGVASVNGTYYPTLNEAIENAASGTTDAEKTVTLLTDVALTENTAISGDIVIDLDSKTLDITGYDLTLSDSTGVTVKNGTVTGGEVDKIINTGKAVLDGVTFIGTVDTQANSEIDVTGASHIGTLVVGANVPLSIGAGATIDNIILKPGVIITLAEDNKLITADDCVCSFSDGAINFVSGKVRAYTESATLTVADGAATAEVTLLPAKAGEGVYVNVTETGAATVGGAAEGDKAVINGKTVTLKVGEDYAVIVTEPLQPFPNGSTVILPKGKSVIIDPAVGADYPIVAAGDDNTDNLILIPTEGNYPVTARVAEQGDTVIIYPDATNSKAYTAASAGAELLIGSAGEATLVKGGVELDKSENILIKNANGKTVTVSVPADMPTAVLSANDDGSYSVSIPEGGAVEIGGKKFTNEDSAAAALKVTVDANGKAVVEIVSGTVGVPDGQQVTVGNGKLENATGDAIIVSDDGSVVIGKNEFTYTGKSESDETGVKFEKAASGEIVATMNDDGAKLLVKPVSDDADVKITNSDAYALVKSESAGTVEVEKSEDGLNVTVTGDADAPTKVEMGGTEYTVPNGSNATFTTGAANVLPTLTSGSVELDDGEAIIVDGVTVENTTGAVLTVTETDTPAGTDDGKFVLKSDNDTFNYTKGTSDSDLTVTKNESGDALRFVLNTANETVEFKGTNEQDTEFSNGTSVLLTVNGNSKGDVSVKKTASGFEALIENGSGETSDVKVGNTTYTIPENSATLLIGSDDPTKTPTLVENSLKLDNNENVGIPTADGENPYNVKYSGTGSLLATKGKDHAVFELPVNGKITFNSTDYSTLSGKSAKIDATYVEDGTGDVVISGDKGIKLVLKEGAVSLTKGQTIHTDSYAQITNSNDDNVAVEVDAASGDTVITLAKDQSIKVDGVEYTAKADGGAKIAVDKVTGKPKLIVGSIEMEGGNSIKVNDWTVAVPDGKLPITVGFGTPAEIELQPDGEMIIKDKDGNEFTYVNNSKSAVKPQINADGKLTLTLTNNASPANLPAGSYESINIRKNGSNATYTFEDDLDHVLARENIEEGDVIVLNTGLETKPSTDSYILTQNRYTIYGVGGDLAKQNKEGTRYSSGHFTVDSRERAAQYGVPDMADALKDCMVVKVENGVVTVQAGEARIKWSDTDTTYYVTLEDAFFDAANPADISKSVYNTHDGKGTSQTIIMNINPYADRKKIMLENGDKLVTCGEDPSRTGDSYTAQCDTTISMFTNSNDVYILNGSLTAAPSADDTDKTVIVYLDKKGHYAQSEDPIVVTVGDAIGSGKSADVLSAIHFTNVENGHSITVGLGGSRTYTYTKVVGGWNISDKSGKLVSGPAGSLWTYENGVFSQTVTEKVSRGFFLWNVLFGRKTVSTTYYLTETGYSLTPTPYSMTIEPDHAPAYTNLDATHHMVYCGRCGKVLSESEPCTFENGHCKFCGMEGSSVDGYIKVKVNYHTSGFLFFKLYMADIYVSSDIVGIKSVKYCTDEYGLEYTVGTKIISTKPISTIIVVVEATDGAHAYKYDVATGSLSNYDLIK